MRFPPAMFGRRGFNLTTFTQYYIASDASYANIRRFVAAIVPVTTSGSGGRAGGRGATATTAAAAAATIPAAAAAGRPAGLHASAVCNQRRARGGPIRERTDRGGAPLLRGGRAVGSVPRPGGAARAAAGAAAPAAADAAAGRATSERAGAVCDPLLRPQLAGDGRPQRHAAAAGVAGRRAGPAPVPRARAPCPHARATDRAAAAATAAR